MPVLSLRRPRLAQVIDGSCLPLPVAAVRPSTVSLPNCKHCEHSYLKISKPASDPDNSTTNDLTSNLSQGIASFLGLSAFEGVIELIVRCVSHFPLAFRGTMNLVKLTLLPQSFFGLNLAFNGVVSYLISFISLSILLDRPASS